jgi:hypothetical protein
VAYGPRPPDGCRMIMEPGRPRPRPSRPLRVPERGRAAAGSSASSSLRLCRLLQAVVAGSGSTRSLRWNPRAPRRGDRDRRDRSQLLVGQPTHQVGWRAKPPGPYAAGCPRESLGATVGALLGRITSTIARRWLG